MPPIIGAAGSKSDPAVHDRWRTWQTGSSSTERALQTPWGRAAGKLDQRGVRSPYRQYTRSSSAFPAAKLRIVWRWPEQRDLDILFGPIVGGLLGPRPG